MKNICFGLFLILFTCPVYAQQKSAYDRVRDSIRAAYDRRRQLKIDEYERFRDSCNAAYAKFLAKSWSRFEGKKGLEPPKEEMRLPEEVLEQMRHPKQMEAKQQTANAEETAFNVRGVVSSVRDFFKRLQPPKPMVKERSSKWTRRKQQVDEQDYREGIQEMVQEDVPEQPLIEETGVFLMPFDFYGTEMQVDIGKLRDELHLPKAASGAVSKAWTLCSETRYVSLIQDCLSLKREYHLGDWAYLQMIKTMAEEAFGKDSNESIFLTAYIYCQSGYRIRLGNDGDKLLMLFTTHHQIYRKPYWPIDNQNFYSLQPSQTMSTIHVCDKAINAQEQPLSLWMKEPLKLEDTSSKPRTIQSDKYPNIKMEVKVNENLIRYYNDYPNSQLGEDVLTRWAIYADTPMNEEVKKQIYPALQDQLKDLPEDEQVCRLLSLIQPRDTTYGVNPWQSLVYRYDDVCWGGDRAFFPEETLYYPYSDCEDHAILFSRLVRDLIGLKVLLVYYKAPESAGGHLAAAVHFNQTPSMGNSDAFSYDGEIYHICDPTNWDPRPGVSMNGMNYKAAQVILLNSE
ncbi:MAG: hypothetical protein J6W75_10735 [Bacteroidaceae bacterium]|nr:hypothetical protein [Bacteroidaceae bacterium]